PVGDVHPDSGNLPGPARPHPERATAVQHLGAAGACLHYLRHVDLVLLGVRGSTPAPGPDFVRYGGHTSCVAVVPTGAVAPTLLMDAGTGIGSLGTLLGPAP